MVTFLTICSVCLYLSHSFWWYGPLSYWFFHSLINQFLNTFLFVLFSRNFLSSLHFLFNCLWPVQKVLLLIIYFQGFFCTFDKVLIVFGTSSKHVDLCEALFDKLCYSLLIIVVDYELFASIWKEIFEMIKYINENFVCAKTTQFGVSISPSFLIF